jgi:hypothetical protein
MPPKENSVHTGWYLVFDTDQYAGNFEREMCAYLTGVIGDCGKGQSMQEHFRDDHPELVEDYEDSIFAEQLSQEQDDHGCRRPVQIWTTPGWFNTGSGQHFRDGHDPEEVTRITVESKVAYERKYQKEPTPEQIEEWKQWRKWPAYNSVALNFYKKPDEETVQFLIERAKTFAAKRFDQMGKSYCSPTPFKLEGVRLIETRKTTIQVQEWEI